MLHCSHVLFPGGKNKREEKKEEEKKTTLALLSAKKRKKKSFLTFVFFLSFPVHVNVSRSNASANAFEMFPVMR